ncbi:MAG: hypothetical protein C0484_12880 [Rhodospirillum sp.]|nr:hypothetical protein [Rhodospirillum sp.]
MKVFLSHSSKDKGFVEAVAELLRPGTFELDSQTFDAGLINSEAIINALKRSDLFCLFLSENSIRSSYVDFETLLGVELLARGEIGKFLAVCIDERAFADASANIKFFNAVRKGVGIESTARMIQGVLVAAAAARATESHPFMGRADELLELERQVTDHSKPTTRAIFISGNFGSGRRTLARKFYANQYPRVGQIFPTVDVESFAGLEELFRKVLLALRPAITATELKTRIQAFTVAPEQERLRQIGQILNSLLLANEATYLMDMGGILTDAGQLEPEIDAIISTLESKPHPAAIIIAPRMVPLKLRRKEKDLAYLALRSLKHDAGERLMSRLLLDKGLKVAPEELRDLVALADGHPFNFYRLMEELETQSVTALLANPSDFIEWKHRQSSEYLSRITLSKEERLILGLLRLVPELDFAALISALSLDPGATSDALLRLANLHVVEPVAERVKVSPALRIAVERDKRVSLPQTVRTSAMRTLSQSLSIRLEEGDAPVALIDTAVLATLEDGSELPEFTAAFILPSHYVWLAKRHYDERRYEECIRLSKEALKGASRLSSGGLVAASRYMCLAAARIGDVATFDDGLRRLKAKASGDWALSNVAFLQGFHSRFQGNLPKAEEFHREAYKLSPGNTSAAREIASICLARGNLEEAEKFAREAHGQATRNAYLLDTLIAVLVRRYGKSSAHIGELNGLFDVLETVGEEAGKSFFSTRKAEFEHLWGNNKLALKFIEKAVAKTPSIFEPRKLYAEILLKEGNKAKAFEVIQELERQVNSRDPGERRSNYRAYLEIHSHYLVEVGQFKEAKDLYDDTSVFTDAERKGAKKEIEVIQAYRSR